MKTPRAPAFALAMFCALAALYPALGHGQQFPDRPIKVIVPFPAGGPVDTLARALGQGFQQRTGQQFIVESRPGANTSLGALACKQSAPDGYTLCLLASTSVSLNPHLYKDLRYTPADLAPVTNIAVSRAAFLVHKSVPATTLAEFVAWSKKHPEKMNYASFGVGSETQRPFALVVVGGMLSALAVALWLLPVVYSFITPKRLATPEEEDEQIVDEQ